MASAGPHRFHADDYDTLVDSPIVVGNPAVYDFTVDGVPHQLVNVGEGGIFDGATAAKDLETIVGEHRRQGHAERALRALEAEVGRLGLQGIALHVFGHNTGAQALYGKLGYVPTNINMFKAVPAGA